MGNHGPVRGTNDVELAVHTTEDDETVEYVEETDSVRYVGGWRRPSDGELKDSTDRLPIFESTPYTRWSETKCVQGAAEAAAEYVNKQLDTDEAKWGISVAITDERRIDAVVWVLAAMYSPDETLIHETTLDFETVVAATPATVTASYLLSDHERELVVPIYTRFNVFNQE